MLIEYLAGHAGPWRREANDRRSPELEDPRIRMAGGHRPWKSMPRVVLTSPSQENPRRNWSSGALAVRFGFGAKCSDKEKGLAISLKAKALKHEDIRLGSLLLPLTTLHGLPRRWRRGGGRRGR